MLRRAIAKPEMVSKNRVGNALLIFKGGSARRWFVLFMTAAIGLLANAPALPSISTNLTKLSTLAVLVEDVNSNSCGLTKEDVDTSLRFVLNQSKIFIPNAGAQDYIYLNVSILDDCSAASVELNVNSEVKVVSNQRVVYGATIWNEGELLSGPNMRSRVMTAVEELAKRLVVVWSSVNAGLRVAPQN